MGRKPKEVELKDPTPALVREYVQKFEQTERSFLSDQAIAKLLHLIPDNKDFGDILLKVSVVNDLYNTGILATFDMAEHILKLNIDPELSKRSTDVVDRIASISLSGKKRCFFSFATKYCNWHDRDNYPIYDSFVEKLIIAYKNRDKFAAFKNDELRHYARFKEILETFRNHYGLAEFGFKKLDKFLWLYGMEKFPKNYASRARISSN